jgi:antitoxin (DNA-binding transcriptional repressor) of toxin-antitoxin stability system
MAAMKRIDLDDLPPKLAALLTGVEEGEEVLLVQDGVVAGRLTGGAPAPRAEAEAEPPSSEEQAKEIFEQFRSIMEDEF